MLHLMPQIERVVDSGPPSQPQQPATRSNFQKQVQEDVTRSVFQKQLREDMFVIIHDECQDLRHSLEETLRRSEQAQQETLKRFLSDHTAHNSSSWNWTSTAAPVLTTGFAMSDSLQPDGRINFHAAPSQARVDVAEEKQVFLDEATPTAVGTFQLRAARMAERGHGGNELAEASGWGKNKVSDDVKEQQFPKGVDCCHFKSRDTLLRIIKGKPFELLSSAVIATNAVFMGLKANATLDAAIAGHFYDTPTFVKFMENLFIVFFTVEWLMRFMVYQKWFFKVEDWKWHAFDTLLVLLSFVEIIIEVAAGSLQQTMLLRIFRVARLVRLLKIARYLTFFRELRMMIFGLIASLRSLLWSFVMLALVVYIFSIIFVQAAISFLQRDNFAGEPEELRDAYVEWFGSTQLSMRSLLVAISGGTDWIVFCQMLEVVNPFYSLMFILYIMLVFHGVLHVIASIFVDSAMNTSKQEKDDLIVQEMNDKNSYMSLIQTVLQEADKDGSGTVSWDEFQKYLNDPRIIDFFRAIELDGTEARGLYKLLDVDESDEVPIDEFATSCFRLKGNAKSLDLVSLMHENKKVMRVLMKFMSYAEGQFELLQGKAH